MPPSITSKPSLPKRGDLIARWRAVLDQICAIIAPAREIMRRGGSSELRADTPDYGATNSRVCLRGASRPNDAFMVLHCRQGSSFGRVTFRT